jgi:Asp-tRNA(Asn)/Glu-tRNA(Gln) amidotransferase A subunit family amidase
MAYDLVSVGGARRPADLDYPLHVAVLDDLVADSAPEVAAAIAQAAEQFAERGVRVTRMRLGWRPRGFAQLLSADLARVWSQRVDRAPELFDEELRCSIDYGRAASALQIQITLRDIRSARRELGRRMRGVTAVLAPTTPDPVPPAGARFTKRSLEFTRIFSALWWPSITVPLWDGDRRLPLAAHLAAPGVDPAGLLRVAEVLEEAVSAECPTPPR